MRGIAVVDFIGHGVSDFPASGESGQGDGPHRSTADDGVCVEGEFRRRVGSDGVHEGGNGVGGRNVAGDV